MTTGIDARLRGAIGSFGTRATTYRDCGEWSGRTITEMLRTSVERAPDAPALATVDGVLSYGDLDRRSDAFASSLIGTGLPPASTVLFQLGNELETIVALYGVIKAAMLPVCGIPNQGLHEACAIADSTGARVHLFQDDYRSYDLRHLSSELTARCSSVDTRVVVRGGGDDDTLSFEQMAEVSDPARARKAVDRAQRGVSPEAPAVLQLSSGTTGVPKVIPHSHATYLSASARWAANLGWDATATNLHFIPTMHHAGLGTVVFPTHLVGGHVVLARSVDPELLVGLIETHRVRWMHFNLAALRPLSDHAREVDCDFSSFTHFTWGHVRPQLSERAEELLGAVAVGSFGMGEGVHLSARRDDPAEIRRFTCGSVIGEHDEVVVRDPEGEEPVPDGEIGELTFRGPSVVPAYLDPQDTIRSFTGDGFLRSGDLGRARAVAGRRCFTVEGRLKDQISRGGEKFMAAELEALLADHPDVREVAAVGLPDQRLGERVCVAVIPEAHGASVPPEELRKRLVDHLRGMGVAKFKWPERIAVVDAMPRTGIGKVRKDELREQVVAMLCDEDPT